MRHTPVKVLPARLARSLSIALAAATLGLAGNGVHAASFELMDGELYGSWDTTLSIGASWRMDKRDQAIVGISNGGTAFSVNGDDGNLNFNRGKTFSETFKVTSELELNYGNWGAFFRGLYFVDAVIDGNDTERTTLPQSSQDLSGQRLDLLDAFVRYQFDIGAMPAELRVGEQVVNWGESTFIQGGNNVINHINVAALRVPGAELREALLPQDLVWFSLGTTENTTLELVYQYDWDDTEPDAAGTYFGTNDFATDGGSEVRLGFGDTPDFPNPEFSDPSRGFNTIPRTTTDGPDDGGQYGLAFRWFLPDFNNGTELGFYFYNYHSRLPLINARTGSFEGLQAAVPISIGAGAVIGDALTTLAVTGDPEAAVNAGAATGIAVGIEDFAAFGIADQAVDAALAGEDGVAAGATWAGYYATDLFANTPCMSTANCDADQIGQTSAYFTSYPEDIQMIGISFNTTWGQWAWQGEWSHHMDKPLQVDDLELLFAGLSPLRPQFSEFGQLGSFSFNNLSGDPQFNPDTPPLTRINGFKRKDTSQFQVTATRLYGPTLGASQAVLLFEGALYRVHRFEKQSELRYNGPGTYVSGNAELADLAHPGKPFENADRFPDQNSWGYRLAGRLDYSNLIGPINVFPRFSWQHDVRGISPGPGGPFLEDRKALTLGVNFTYLSAWEADVSYTMFHGAGRYNLNTDRDFLAATLKFRF